MASIRKSSLNYFRWKSLRIFNEISSWVMIMLPDYERYKVFRIRLKVNRNVYSILKISLFENNDFQIIKLSIFHVLDNFLF